MPEAVSTPDQRERILAAALTVLDRDGEARFTVRNVAAEAGCSTTGVYTWFGGKNGLVDAIFVEGFEGFDRALADAYAADDPIALGHAYRDWALANRTHYLVMFGRAVPDHDPADEAMLRGYRSFLDLVALFDRRGAASPAEAFEAAYHYNALVHGYVMTELTGMSPAPPDEVERLYTLGLAQATAMLP